MPKRANELTALDLKRLKHPGGMYPVNVAVGGVTGLNVQITPSDAKSWILRATVGGRRRMMGLGSYPDVSLAQARERAREARDTIWRGEDPVEERRAARDALKAARARHMTFREAADRVLAAKAKEFESARHEDQWRSTLENYANPVLGGMAVSEIDVTDVLRALEPIWLEKTSTATRLRARIEAVLAWATVGGYRSGDNAARWKGNLDAVLPRPTRVAKADHHPAIALTDAADWLADIKAKGTSSARALAFMAMTATRSGEVRGATWDEIDLDAGLWVIPASRMKMRKEHRVPLPDTAIDFLRRLPRKDSNPLVFPSPSGKEMRDQSISKLMREISDAREGGYLDSRSGRPAVPHGLRSTFRDWAAERGFDRDMAEIALAHTVGSDVERAYRRGDMLDRRRAMMAAWADFLAGRATETVVAMRGATA